MREVARTAPYMHDGSLATLEERQVEDQAVIQIICPSVDVRVDVETFPVLAPSTERQRKLLGRLEGRYFAKSRDAGRVNILG